MKQKIDIKLVEENLAYCCRILCAALRFQVNFWDSSQNQFILELEDSEFVFDDYYEIATDLNFICKAENALIERGRKYDYGEKLIELNGMGGSHQTGISANGICEIATSSAITRLCAMLLVLGIEEIEVNK